MAFLPIFLLSVIEFLIIAIVIFSIIWFIGLIVTTVSAIRRGKAVRAGIKPHKAGLITGITLMALPAVIVGGIVLCLAIGGGENTYSISKHYRDSLQSGIETNDAQLIYTAFSQYTKNRDPKLYTDIEKMLAFISGDVESISAGYPSQNVEIYGEDFSIEKESFNGRMENIVTDSGQEYKIYYFGYCKYVDDENRLGLERVIVYCGDEKIDIGIDTR